MKDFLRKYWLSITIVLLSIVLLIAWAVWLKKSFNNVVDKDSEVMLERKAWYQIEIDGEPVLYYADMIDDTVMHLLSETRDTTILMTYAYGRWANKYWWLPSGRGRIVAHLDSLSNPDFNIKDMLNRNAVRVKKEIADMSIMTKEMDYFFSVHSVQDEGYMLVTDRYERNMAEYQRMSKILAKLERCLTADSLTISHKAEYNALYSNEEGKTMIDTCLFTGQMFRLKSKKTPDDVRIISYKDTVGLGLRYNKQRCSVIFPHPPVDGFALRVTPEKGVQLGEWKNGKFKGQRIVHNKERIYGIDISRFQHEKGRRRYPINWKKMRITSLGTLSKKRVSGKVDYPVSFCYIKTTEGRTIRNKYYATDYFQAKKHGIKTGVYHFFSTKSSASQQAAWFFKNAKYQKEDLPPVLDLEPSDAQIRKMGGVEIMFREVRTWLNAVERRWGVKPILYINQRFVNKYLPLASDIKEKYNVWIARYGEYKPDVHMLYWQLSPDGRVAGITPEVDINVFNGYADKFNEYIEGLTKEQNGKK